MQYTLCVSVWGGSFRHFRCYHLKDSYPSVNIVSSLVNTLDNYLDYHLFDRTHAIWQIYHVSIISLAVYFFFPPSLSSVPTFAKEIDTTQGGRMWIWWVLREIPNEKKEDMH